MTKTRFNTEAEACNYKRLHQLDQMSAEPIGGGKWGLVYPIKSHITVNDGAPAGMRQHCLQPIQATLNLSVGTETESSTPTALGEGETRWIGNWQVRNFNGYYQSREGGAGPWKFYVSGFDSTTTGQEGSCSLILVGGGREAVPIDANDRITVRGVKYARSHWNH